jgi:coenzyme F420-0:L-glutamate ligase/coenzyme F420-1:gamma-L-glutamate ligase
MKRRRTISRIAKHVPRNHVPGEIRILPIAVRGEIRAGQSLSATILSAANASKLSFQDGDIVVVKHKVVSKSEGAIVALDEIRPSSAESRTWARRYGLDARVTELALRESRRVVRRKHGIMITETKHGFICANSGIDVSNVDGGHHAVLLPENADRSAGKLRRDFKKQLGIEIAVIVSDSFGRPWREGLTEVAIASPACAPSSTIADAATHTAIRSMPPSTR